MRPKSRHIPAPVADARVTAVGERRPMPLPADRVVLPPEVRRFLERLAALPTAHWLDAAEAFGAARRTDAMTQLALESLTRVVANASTSPWEATRLQLVWERASTYLW